MRHYRLSLLFFAKLQKLIYSYQSSDKIEYILKLHRVPLYVHHLEPYVYGEVWDD